MKLWHMDLFRSLPLADGTPTAGFIGIDRASRMCVCAQLIATESSEGVWRGLRSAIASHGAPDQIETTYALTFTRGDGTMDHQTPFDELCVEHGIEHLITRCRLPRGMSSIERVSQQMMDALICSTRRFTDIISAQHAVDSWVASYNADRAAKN